MKKVGREEEGDITHHNQRHITNYIWSRYIYTMIIMMMMDGHDDDDGLVHTELVSERPNSSPQSSKAPLMKS